jgi:crotonobetainyl-CoA:carnitine CoA-transferase CaiB-like acyl-CoA transferase
MSVASAVTEETPASDRIAEAILDTLNSPATSSDFDFYKGVNEVLADVGMSAADCGGQLSFYGQDPIVPSRIRFATMAAIGLAAKTIAVAAVWRDRTGQGQDIHVDVRKAFRRFCGFFEGIWETVNGRGPAMGFFENSPFFKFPLFRETRDGRHVVTLNIYPKLHQRALNFFRCSDSVESLQNAILQWRADDLETAAAEEG